ncbi:RidA family protein [Magnetospira thiophila]
MTATVAQRLQDLGLEIPEAVAPVANYVPFVVTGNLVVVSGQVPIQSGQVAFKGKLGAGVSLEDGIAAARLCAINIIAQVKTACNGDLERVKRVVRLGGFVACTADFADHPKVINGASDLMVAVFGDAGRHARAAVGCPSLPLDVPVEVDALVEIA